MTTKNLVALSVAAVVLGVAAYVLTDNSKGSSPRLNGRKVCPEFRIADVTGIEFGDKLKLVAGTNGWTVDTYSDYPAAPNRITDNLIKLVELKVGQVVRGKKLADTTDLVLRDAAGKELVKLALGEKHAKWGHGRYASFEGETVLVSDSLDAFGTDAKQWIETKVVDEPWISFNSLADAKLTEADFGFSTGVVAKVTIAGDTNRTVTVGNVVKGGSDRYLKINGEKWTYVVPSYSVEKLLPKKDELKKEESKEETTKKDDAKKEETKK